MNFRIDGKYLCVDDGARHVMTVKLPIEEIYFTHTNTVGLVMASGDMMTIFDPEYDQWIS